MAEGNIQSGSGDVQGEARIRAQIQSGVPKVSATVRVQYADRIEVEDSQTLKYLRLRTGDVYGLAQAVFLVVEGERYEITQDTLPEEEPR